MPQSNDRKILLNERTLSKNASKRQASSKASMAKYLRRM
jgi:hypothetical protein